MEDRSVLEREAAVLPARDTSGDRHIGEGAILEINEDDIADDGRTGRGVGRARPRGGGGGAGCSEHGHGQQGRRGQDAEDTVHYLPPFAPLIRLNGRRGRKPGGPSSGHGTPPAPSRVTGGVPCLRQSSVTGRRTGR